MSKRKKPARIKDPHAKREAQRYEHPIASREAIIEHLRDRGVLLGRTQLALELGLGKARDQEALNRRLTAMVRDGQLIQNRRGTYGLPDKMDLITGRVIGHADGFGFLRPEVGGDDIFLSPKQMRSVLHGDKVIVSVVSYDRRGRPEGKIIQVLERANTQLVGRFIAEGGVGFVIPDDRRVAQDVLIPQGKTGKASANDMVLIKLTSQPDKHRQPMGEVLEVLGAPNDPGMAVDIAIRSYNLPYGWPDEVIAEADELPDEPEGDLAAGREDLRAMDFVTIDGSDARDFDDAVFAEEDGSGWKLWVAIADVSHYVKPDSPLDKEAKSRGTSAYFPGRVVPMLPEKLSNGLCSLKPAVDRLTMVCEMRLDEKANISAYRFSRAVIHSSARLTYQQVWDVLQGELDENNPALARKADLQVLYGLYQALARQRDKRGALDFDSTEAKFVFSDDGHVSDVVQVHRNDAHKLIEECMISANVCAAKFLADKKFPTPFRVHEPPPQESLDNLATFLGEVGLSFPKSDKVGPKDFSRVVEQSKDRPDRHMIQMSLLRAQNMAVYQTKNLGHFGLALTHYAHFTSPIRRYADLLVHRAIGWFIDHGNSKDFIYTQKQMEQLAEHCSMRDRNAEDASRAAEDRLKCLFMADKIGEEFEGIVAGVTSFGLFVETIDTLITGLVHITSLPNDYYHYNALHHRLQGERSGRVYHLGDKLRVQLVRVDLEDRKIDFNLAE